MYLSQPDNVYCFGGDEVCDGAIWGNVLGAFFELEVMSEGVYWGSWTRSAGWCTAG